MNKKDILENIEVEKLVFWGKGFAKLADGKVIFITWWAIPKSIVNLKILKKRKDFIETQIIEVVKKSPLETENYKEMTWAPWIQISYEEQLKIKQSQVKEALFHLQKYQKDIPLSDIEGSPNTIGYRNKIEFSFWKYISAKEWREEHFNVWFHKRGEFSRIEDYEDCILIDEELNKIYREIRAFTKSSRLPTFDQKKAEWFYRHLVMRKWHYTQEIMIILSFHPWFLEKIGDKDVHLNKIKSFLCSLPKSFPNLASIYLSHNANLADISIGELELIYGKENILEKILWLSFEISPKSFFQTNSLWAEKLYQVTRNTLNTTEKKIPILLDLYAGTGTIWMILSPFAEKVYSVELVKDASIDGVKNAKNNHIENIVFENKKVETFLSDFKKHNILPDVLVIDPPRAWMHPDALPNIIEFSPEQIIYVSCNPATLWRDLEYLIKDGKYTITFVQAVDMFPHTHHIEVVVKLEKK